MGAGSLTPTPAATLATLLEQYLDTHTDPTLSAVLAQLSSGAGFLVAPLGGLSDALTMRNRGVQLGVGVPANSEYAELTALVKPIVADANREGGPAFDSSFNPLRAGYLKLSLTLVDVFGQKRAVQFPELVCANSMTTVADGATVPSVAYMQPRISQPCRLAVHWLAADGSDMEEMTANPATTPVCGWLLPNHVDGSLALYDQLGRPLGTLFPEHRGGTPAVGWQSAPGNAATIDEDLQTVMAFQNPQLRDVALALGAASAETFAAMWKVIDTVGDTIAPGPLPSNSDLAVLFGRPIALVQAAVRLELCGAAMLDLGWDATDADTDAGLTGVQFPVVLGDLAKLRDGLIGYYTQTAPGAGYDLKTFYSQGAPAGGSAGVVVPAQDTLCVTPTPPLDPDGGEPPDLKPYTQKVLMLVDPRAAVHLTTGILPTASLTLPPEQTRATMSVLDLSFFTSPVLRGASALSIPTPRESGFALSFIGQGHDSGGALEWVVIPEIDPPSDDAVWAYTPQQVLEGWLRLNPIVVSFALTNAEGKPAVQAGKPNALTLTVTNNARRTVRLVHGAPVAEGAPPSGSIFYVHCGTLVAQADVGKIAFSAPGWTFQSFSSPQYGAYWAAAPAADVVLADGAGVAIAVTGLVPSPPGAQAQVSFDYYAIDGVDDGVFADVLTVQAAQRF